MRFRDLWQDFDWALFAAIMVLSCISVLEIYSATKNTPIEQSAAFRQLAWIAIGIILLFVVAATDYRVISEQVPWLYLAGIAVLIYTLALGRTVAGSKSWIVLGPMRFQPSELVKIIVIIAVARYLSELRGIRHVNLEQILKASLVCGIPVLLVALQPIWDDDYLPSNSGGRLLVRGVKPTMLDRDGAYRGPRFTCRMAVSRPASERQDSGLCESRSESEGSGYQVNHRDRDWFRRDSGQGVFKGSQNQLGFLPTRHTDFILSVVGEEMGFVGVA
jgi:rod shape determining protein RodA